MIFGPFLGKCLKYFDETWTEVRQKDFEAGAGSRLRIGGPIMLGLFDKNFAPPPTTRGLDTMFYRLVDYVPVGGGPFRPH